MLGVPLVRPPIRSMGHMKDQTSTSRPKCWSFVERCRKSKLNLNVLLLQAPKTLALPALSARCCHPRSFYSEKSWASDDMVVSQNKGPQYKPQNTIVLLIGTPKMVPLILGNSHIRCPHWEIFGSWSDRQAMRNLNSANSVLQSIILSETKASHCDTHRCRVLGFIGFRFLLALVQMAQASNCVLSWLAAARIERD